MDNFTTELEAVNTMLSAVGTSPINSLVAPLGAEATIAKNVLTETRREVLARGWTFNYETKVTLKPDTNNQINLSQTVLRIDGTTGYNTALDLVQRGTRLYDRKDHTYTITSEVTVDVIYNLDWTELPEAARRYVMIRAARIFADRVIGYNHQHAFTAVDEIQALTDLKDAEGDTGDHNMLTGNWAVARVVHRASPIRDVSF